MHFVAASLFGQTNVPVGCEVLTRHNGHFPKCLAKLFVTQTGKQSTMAGALWPRKFLLKYKWSLAMALYALLKKIDDAISWILHKVLSEFIMASDRIEQLLTRLNNNTLLHIYIEYFEEQKQRCIDINL